METTIETTTARPAEEVAFDLTKAFETQTCGRCGGSGHYSYCSMYGTTCFGCRGKKNVYSKRGLAAVAYAQSLRTVPVSEVQPGWLYWVDGCSIVGTKAGWFPIEAIETSQTSYSSSKDANGIERRSYYTFIKTSQISSGVFADSRVQAVPDRARLAEIRALALAYQATLDKNGTTLEMRRAAREARLAKSKASA